MTSKKGLCLAEAGVYRGAFARAINKRFPDVDLFLYDTYEGFTDQDMEIELMILTTSGQQSYNIRTRFLNYADKIPITSGQGS